MIDGDDDPATVRLNSHHEIQMIRGSIVATAAADGSGTPASSYSSFYIRPATAAIRVAVATAASAAPPTTVADNDDEKNKRN